MRGCGRLLARIIDSRIHSAANDSKNAKAKLKSLHNEVVEAIVLLANLDNLSLQIEFVESNLAGVDIPGLAQ
jgi:hypothetical protein